MRMSAFQRVLLIIAALVLVVSVTVAAQAAWPVRPVQLIVPFPAGGGVDAIARPFAELWSEILHQPVVVIPRDGAAGTIGTAAVAAAKPDGYTFAFTPNGPITVQPHIIASCRTSTTISCPCASYSPCNTFWPFARTVLTRRCAISSRRQRRSRGAQAQGFLPLATFAEARQHEIPIRRR